MAWTLVDASRPESTAMVIYREYATAAFSNAFAKSQYLEVGLNVLA